MQTTVLINRNFTPSSSTCLPISLPPISPSNPSFSLLPLPLSLQDPTLAGTAQSTAAMGKLLCDSTSVTDTLQPSSPPLLTWKDSIDAVDLSPATWETVAGLEDQQRRNLSKLQARGVLWKPPPPNHDDESSFSPVVFRLSHGGDVDSDGNCLFTASQKAMAAVGVTEDVDSRELRRRTVRRFLEDLGSASEEDREMVKSAIMHMYSPDLKSGWGIHVVQEVKLLAKKTDRESMDSAIAELLNLGMQREAAAESIYKERCIAVDDGSSWAKYMSISGCPDDEYDIITLQYIEDGLLSVDENREGRAAAFGDDIAIECLATEFNREIYVVQAHGSDGMVDEDNCVFFLPHRPRGQICGPPFFLFMKGTGWCGAGADHYEPLIATPTLISPEKVAFVL